MRILTIFFLSLILVASTANALLLNTTLKGGGTFSSDQGGSPPGNGFVGGFGLDIGVPFFGIMADAFYASRVYGFDGTTDTIEVRQWFIPVQFRFSLAPMIRWTLGGYYSEGIGDVRVRQGSSVSDRTFTEAHIQSKDHGACIGLSLLMPSPTWAMLLEARYNHGLVDTDPGNPVVRNASADLLVGLMF